MIFTAKISFQFEEKFIAYLKTTGARWDPQARVWNVPESEVPKIESKAKELKVQKLKITRDQATPASKPIEGVIKMRKSQNGRFVLISMNLIAFTEDARQMLDGERQNVRFKVLPPIQVQPPSTQ